MVPRGKAKNRKMPSLQLDYLIHIQEIKPWPPSQSLRTLRAVLIQWEHGDRNSGLTSQVIPSLGTGLGVGDGRIAFNESFRLPVTLVRELSSKGGDRDSFQKNCIEFNLFEPRRDKTVKGQLLGTAVVDLAEYGVVKEALCTSAAINCKRAYRNTTQPFLFLKIKSIDKIQTNISLRDSLTRPSQIQKNGVDSLSALMSEENAEEAETASFIDDDVSSHSSMATSPSLVESNGGSLFHTEVVSTQLQSGLESIKASSGESEGVPALTHDLSKPDEKHFALSTASSKAGSSRSSSTDLSFDLAWFAKNTASSTAQFSSSSRQCEVMEEYDNCNSITGPNDEVPGDIRLEVLPGEGCVLPDSAGASIPAGPPNKIVSCVNSAEKLDLVDSFYSSIKESVDHDGMVPSTKGTYKTAISNITEDNHVNSRIGKGQEKGEHTEITEERDQCLEEQPGISFSQDGSGADGGSSLSPNRDDKFRHVRSVRSSLNSNRSSELLRTSQSIQKDLQNGAQGYMKNDRKDNKMHLKETRTSLPERKMQHLEQRVKKLEWELTVTAAIEAALYSVVAEHGSSINKVHAPARRLSRFYIHAAQVNSQLGRASAARSAISGLILVTKACGNDVPRLTFWLSNSILLRAIITESLGEEQLPFSVHPVTGRNGKENRKKRSSPLKWRHFSSALSGSFDDWEDPETLETALQKVEGWIFSRIIESIWWQNLTPHMQSGAAKAIKMSGDQEQGTFSLELWKKAFRDAYERICPVRAEGHECGCLPVLSRLIMEQCVARLDVAMFNAILRESTDDIPTDPISDPISDAKVLPIPAGKASFGAGAQLKNAIGNWSRWLTDLFGLDDDCSLEDVNTDETIDDVRSGQGTSLKSFHLLNALSDLMMLPKDMLLSRTVRKEVCPTFGPELIGRVLNIFVPDEFCPDPIPKVVFEALNSEDSFEAEENTVVYFPCPAARINYIPPPPAYVVEILRDGGSHSKLARSGSSLLAKSHTSDDELDVLDSPLSSIYTDSTQSSLLKNPSLMSEENASHNSMRYQLLRKVWKCSE